MPDVETQITVGINDVLGDVVEDFGGLGLGPLVVSLEHSIEKLHAKVFDQELSPSGEQWEPLAESTIKAKGHAIILEDLGDLRQTLTVGGMGDAIRERHTIPGAAEMIFGTSDFKSPFHMDGNDKLPQREHVGLNEIFVGTLVDDSLDYIIEELTETEE